MQNEPGACSGSKTPRVYRGGRGRNGQDFQLYSGFCFAFLKGQSADGERGKGGKAKVVDTQFTSLNGPVNMVESLR